VTAVERFNSLHPATPLPTRIGLHGGRMLLGNIGAMDHYEYRAVGDIVTTATRIEGLNKHLRTQILASRTIIDDLEGFSTRELHKKGHNQGNPQAFPGKQGIGHDQVCCSEDGSGR